MIDPRDEITGVILAGGRGRRMGGVDKGLTQLVGKPMLWHVLEALQPQVTKVIINANRNLESYREFGHQIVSDLIGDFSGPLAGMASGMQAATTTYIVTVPCDSPLIAGDLVARMYHDLNDHAAEICVAHDGKRTHPVFLLLKRDLITSMLEFLNAGERKIDKWFVKHRTTMSNFSDQPEAFLNVNNPQDIEALEESLKKR